MSLASIFDTLGQTVIPDIAAKVFPDTMDVMAAAPTSDNAGGTVKGTPAAVYASVPVAVEHAPKISDDRTDKAGKLYSISHYWLTFPTHQGGSRINLDATHRLKVLARGNEPARTFRIVRIGNEQGVNYSALCIEEI